MPDTDAHGSKGGQLVKFLATTTGFAAETEVERTLPVFVPWVSKDGTWTETPMCHLFLAVPFALLTERKRWLSRLRAVPASCRNIEHLYAAGKLIDAAPTEYVGPTARSRAKSWQANERAGQIRSEGTGAVPASTCYRGQEGPSLRSPPWSCHTADHPRCGHAQRN